MKLQIVIKQIVLTLDLDGSISIFDNGRGIPIDEHPTKRVPAVRLVSGIGSRRKFEVLRMKTLVGCTVWELLL